MEIILMRHGRPDIANSGVIGARNMPGWISRYNEADTGSDVPPSTSRQLAARADTVISSDLPRAISSLKALGYEPVQTDTLYREAELPAYGIGGLRLSPLAWSGIFRVLWLCGLLGNAETLHAAKARAATAAENLATLASNKEGPVLLMGHGIMNRLIARRLLRQGWCEIRKSEEDYWGAGVYRLSE
ncbi:histidine phosphatase family protein [Cronobacter malonaticus]|uniref:histidine phosphatase family protein n=1 Tax=Cronobacter malonaticus TaxID=413503 RepID=UPI0003A26E28|nr:histidine phosphatase family protein [Cronobacter malonaticus]ELY4447940.1 histidine phosphatase family protein [Cronobacter malonaticus]ELY4490920.1 histidine phosphatase family protein [Cronobacter malonaticus]ELY6296468.1 histidine phosphatase family protein [Cronobacter malonaticus]ELY6317382.1 histidine phosphatase family protein [Cronobacter malonaticus]